MLTDKDDRRTLGKILEAVQPKEKGNEVEAVQEKEKGKGKEVDEIYPQIKTT